MAVTGTIAALDLAPEEAIAFLRKKVAVPSEDWTSIWQRANVRSFTVAGATTEALAEDFRQAALKAIETGTTEAEFRKDFDAIVARHGWQHTGTPGWRASIIYETNLSMAYSAGRYQQQIEPETLAAFPFWQYVHSGSLHPRHDHKSWDGLVLRADDPWWQTHYPPNGWRCGCWVRVVSARDMQRMGRSAPDEAPPLQYREWVNRKTGETHKVPKGIDPGFDYNPGAEWAGKPVIPRDATVSAPPRSPAAANPVQATPRRRPVPGTDDGLTTIEQPGAPYRGAPVPPQPAQPAAIRSFAEQALEGAGDPHAELVVARLDDAVARSLESDAREVTLTGWRVRKVAGLAEQTGGLPSNAHPEVTPEVWSAIGSLIDGGRVWKALGERHRYLQVMIEGEAAGRRMMTIVRSVVAPDGSRKLMIPTYQEVGRRRLARLTRAMERVR